MRFLINFSILVGGAWLATAETIDKTCGRSEGIIRYAHERHIAGFGSLSGDFRDKYHETVSIGSAIQITNWAMPAWNDTNNTPYTGILWGLSDRGWNNEGTVNHQPRVHRFTVTLIPDYPTPRERIRLEYLDTILLRDPEGNPTTGLDPDDWGGIEFPYFPLLPSATYLGDGWGGGDQNEITTRVAIDPESLHVDEAAGIMTIGDEYGPMIYTFSMSGRMISATTPPGAFLPYRGSNATHMEPSFSSDDPRIGDPGRWPITAEPASGRPNNRGFEALAVSPSGEEMFALMQAPLMQEGMYKPDKHRVARLLYYKRVARPGGELSHTLEAEYLVPMPRWSKTEKVETLPTYTDMVWLSRWQVLVLARSMGQGRGGSSGTHSAYRQVDVVDLRTAENVLGSKDARYEKTLDPEDGAPNAWARIKPALHCGFLDVNDGIDLYEYGLHSSGEDDVDLMSEKWEGITLANTGAPREWFLFAASDNDYATQNGFVKGGYVTYKDPRKITIDTHILAFRSMSAESDEARCKDW
ncbi:hypothetical protein PspLS_10462 [Pyricularia sp. CBS 133598]|nr:hypothetical protein PspLS_10462 [Pyricularia sp. CBS 133598]